MNGIVININPVALKMGHFTLTWYGIIVIVAIIVTVAISLREAKRKGISSDVIYSLIPWVLIGGFLGARLFHVVDNWGYYTANPLKIFAIWQGGLAIWGALAGGGLAAVIFTRVKHISFGRLADTVVPALLVGQIIGRFACIIDGDATGGVTSLPWGFTYTNPGSMVPSNLFGIPTQPYPVYEQLWDLVGLALVLNLRRYLKTDGLLFLSYLSFYAVGRFMLTFIRHENIWFWGLQEAQVVAFVVFVVSIAMFVYIMRKPKRDVSPTIAA